MSPPFFEFCRTKQRVVQSQPAGSFMSKASKAASGGAGGGGGSSSSSSGSEGELNERLRELKARARSFAPHCSAHTSAAFGSSHCSSHLHTGHCLTSVCATVLATCCVSVLLCVPVWAMLYIGFCFCKAVGVRLTLRYSTLAAWVGAANVHQFVVGWVQRMCTNVLLGWVQRMCTNVLWGWVQGMAKEREAKKKLSKQEQDERNLFSKNKGASRPLCAAKSQPAARSGGVLAVMSQV